MAAKDECIGCLDSSTECELVGLECPEHDLCTVCLRIAIRLAIKDKNHYPVSCGSGACWLISDDDVQRYLTTGQQGDATLLAEYLAKAEEYHVAADTWIYCASQECQIVQGQSGFINPEISGEETRVICPDCNSVTCRVCRDLVDTNNEHVCKEDEHDVEIRECIESLPEEDRWLWQKCCKCRSWTEKVEACNHMTCRCSAQFCLICGQEWTNGASSCRHGCPHFQRPEYDELGYNQFGFHKATGLDRDGNPHDPDVNLEGDVAYENDDGYDDGYDNEDEENIAPRYDDDGYDQFGFDIDQRDRAGFDVNGKCAEECEVSSN